MSDFTQTMIRLSNRGLPFRVYLTNFRIIQGNVGKIKAGAPITAHATQSSMPQRHLLQNMRTDSFPENSTTNVRSKPFLIIRSDSDTITRIQDGGNTQNHPKPGIHPQSAIAGQPPQLQTNPSVTVRSSMYWPSRKVPMSVPMRQRSWMFWPAAAAGNRADVGMNSET